MYNYTVTYGLYIYPNEDSQPLLDNKCDLILYTSTAAYYFPISDYSFVRFS